MKTLSKDSSSNRQLVIVFAISAAAILIGMYFNTSLKGSVTGYGTQAVIVANASVRKGTDLTYAVQAIYGSVSARPVMINTSIRIPWGFTLKSAPSYCNQKGDMVICRPAATPVDGGSDTYMITFSTKGTACQQDAINWTIVDITDNNTQQKATTLSPRVHTRITCN